MEDGRHCVATLTIRGRAFDASFLDFVADRARRFSLDGWTARPRPDEIRIVAAGPNALIDMLEVACMLGPVDALVDEIERRDDAALEVAAGRFKIVGERGPQPGTTFATARRVRPDGKERRD